MNSTKIKTMKEIWIFFKRNLQEMEEFASNRATTTEQPAIFDISNGFKVHRNWFIRTFFLLSFAILVLCGFFSREISVEKNRLHRFCNGFPTNFICPRQHIAAIDWDWQTPSYNRSSSIRKQKVFWICPVPIDVDTMV